jgi:23S rRNA pseudouridine1911/1915/1917 synthase
MTKKRVNSNAKVFHVTASEDGLTLAAALRRFAPELSWTKVRQLIQSRHVQVNGNLAFDFSRRIKTGEVLKLFQHPLAPPPRAEDVQIIYLDEYLVIVNKPSGMTSVRHAKDEAPKGRKQRQLTLEDLMPDILAKQIQPHETQTSKRSPQKNRRSSKRLPARRAKPRVFPVHRLDRDTSGLMMFALSTEVADQLVTMFQSHSIERTYRAVAFGNVRGTTIESFLARDRGDGLRGSVDGNSKNVQHAVTHVRPVKGFGGYTLVECRLETGRTHQIRIHMCEQGHPLCGERMYTHRLGESAVPDQSGAPRLALHAFQLKLLHPIKGRKISVEAPLPPDLENFVNRLKREKKR